MGVLGPARDYTVRGNQKFGLLDMLVMEGSKRGRNYVPDPRPETGGFFRSDGRSWPGPRLHGSREPEIRPARHVGDGRLQARPQLRPRSAAGDRRLLQIGWAFLARPATTRFAGTRNSACSTCW